MPRHYASHLQITFEQCGVNNLSPMHDVLLSFYINWKVKQNFPLQLRETCGVTVYQNSTVKVGPQKRLVTGT